MLHVTQFNVINKMNAIFAAQPIFLAASGMLRVIKHFQGSNDEAQVKQIKNKQFMI